MEYDDAKSLYEKLECLFSPMVYDEVNANGGMGKNDKINLKEICKETNLDEDIVKEILTPDSCIIMEDTYYHPVDFNFEMSQLHKMLSQLKTLDEPGINMNLFEIQKKLKGSGNYDEKMTNYLFEKYTTPIGKGKSSTSVK